MFQLIQNVLILHFEINKQLELKIEMKQECFFSLSYSPFFNKVFPILTYCDVPWARLMTNQSILPNPATDPSLA